MLPAVVVLLAIVASSCSPKKNTAATRKYQEFITRYNIHYNGDTHLKETLAEMETNYQDDYSRLVLMHPVEAKSNPEMPQPTGDFTRSIEKAQKALQLRSIKNKPKRQSGKRNDSAYKEWMKRGEYNPFIHNSWLMLAAGQYYNGDFAGAAATYFYISRQFPWLPKVVAEAKLMQALCYVALGWQFEAEMILTRIKETDLTSSRLQNLYNFAMADYLIHAQEFEQAEPYLRAAVKSANSAQKIRLNFLLGQILARQGKREQAYAAFKTAGSASSASYRTKFNARIKQSEVFSGTDIESEVNALRRMTRYDRNKEYLDQIYYAIGNLYLSHGDTAQAIENYIIANEKSTRSGIDKALNQLTLGRLYFELRNYAKAQPNYAEAVPVLPTTFPDYPAIKQRSDVLDELAVYSQNVNLQDSLLWLADMDSTARMAVINRMIDELKKQEKKDAEDARREEYLANQPDDMLQDNSAPSFNINTDNSWYFYNSATRNAGKTEFQRRWGSRKLEDDWRRRNKASFNTDDFDAAPEEETEENTEEGESKEVEADDTPSEDAQEQLRRSTDPHYPEYYLAQIPFTPEDRATAGDIIQEGLYNMGVILKDKLEDFSASEAEFNRLLKDYPDNTYRLDAYYNLYLMYMRQGRTADAEFYRNLIVTDFPDSKYGQAMRDPEYLDKLKQMDIVQNNLYETTYEAYLDNRNDEVHAALRTMEEDYPMSKIMPKFMFLDALAYVTERNPEQFNSTLRDLLERYPDTDITPIAAAWLKGMAQGRELQAGQKNMRGMIWDLRLTNDTTDVGGNNAPAEFELNPDVPQILIFTFATDEVPSNLLLYEVARHNFRSFVVKDFDLEQMNFGRLGMLLVRGFENREELEHYRRVMNASEEFVLPPGVRPVAISEEDFNILLNEGRSFDEYFEATGENYVPDGEGEPGSPIEPSVATPEEIEAPAMPEIAPEPSVSPQPAPNAPVMPEPEPAHEPEPQPAPTAPATVAPEPIINGPEGDDPLLNEY